MKHGSAGSGQLVVAVLGEAVKKFGRITPQNQAQVTRWVQRRVLEITGQRESAPFDAKAAASGDQS